MSKTRGERLRIARKRHFKSARSAAAALGIPPATYGAHERAQAPGKRGRDYGPEEAAVYGRRFGVRPEWLLTGSGAPDAARLAYEPGNYNLTGAPAIGVISNPSPFASQAIEHPISDRLSLSIERLIAALDRHADRFEKILAQTQRVENLAASIATRVISSTPDAPALTSSETAADPERIAVVKRVLRLIPSTPDAPALTSVGSETATDPELSAVLMRVIDLIPSTPDAPVAADPPELIALVKRVLDLPAPRDSLDRERLYPQLYRWSAEQCLEVAKKTTSAQTKAALLQMAEECSQRADGGAGASPKKRSSA
jgi:hypothetical protein